MINIFNFKIIIWIFFLGYKMVDFELKANMIGYLICGEIQKLLNSVEGICK